MKTLSGQRARLFTAGGTGAGGTQECRPLETVTNRDHIHEGVGRRAGALAEESRITMLEHIFIEGETPSDPSSPASSDAPAAILRR